MNGMFRIFVYSLIVSIYVASHSFSADAAEINKEAAKTTSEQKKEAVIQEGSAKKQDSSKAASVFFPAPKFEFDQMVDGAELTHDFVIMNKGTDTLQVQKVKTG